MSNDSKVSYKKSIVKFNFTRKSNSMFEKIRVASVPENYADGKYLGFFPNLQYLR